ncbi:MAG TPA: hypothetical protein GXX18_03105 [Bacillales bacterium]|nr:hypothetical protein [Bacillales bacterium]
MKKGLVVILLLFVLFFGFIAVRFGSALTQEGNPILYLTSIVKLELSNNGYEKVLKTEYGNRFVTKFNKNYPLGMAKKFMKGKGWKFKEQIGSERNIGLTWVLVVAKQ